MQKKQVKKSNRSRILMRYGMITVVFVLISAAIVGRLITTTVIKADEWNSVADSILNELKPIAPERGNILADNGNILACNVMVYDVKVDMRHQKIKELGKKIPWQKIDSLADSLDVYYPLKADLAQIPAKDSEYSWHKKFRDELGKEHKKRTRTLRIIKKGTLDDFERIKAFPFFKDFKGTGARNPLYTDSKNVRIYPFGKMAYRSVGRVNEVKGEIHGYSGLEKDLDALLYGKTGAAKKVVMTSGIGNWVETPAQRGYDVQTTINIDMQDMLEEELTKICENANAHWGTAILMEVATGEIKALANVEKLDDGTYGEALNRAILGYEPGSVIKPISLMIAFEDGLVKSVNDGVDCSPFQKTTDPHAPSYKTMKQVIEMSSNTGISRVIFRGYGKEPEKYHERLRSIGFFEPMHSGIADETVPILPPLGDKDSWGNKQTMTAAHLSLARQCYGYACMIPPLYTLAYYNAIANDGIMVKPHLVKKLSNEHGDSIVDIEQLSMRVCSAETAEKVRQCLLEPVWGNHGTAKAVQDERVKIAGKTGTAFPTFDKGGGYDTSKRRFAFAGFFPADKPKYSCMVLILSGAGNSAANTSGQVLKNMAVKMFSRGLLDNTSTYTEERSNDVPTFYVTEEGSNAKLSQAFSLKGIKVFTNQKGEPLPGTIPNLSGYDAPTAVRLLEQEGWHVSIEGSGFVTSQTPQAGEALKRGGKVHLKLSI